MNSWSAKIRRLSGVVAFGLIAWGALTRDLRFDWPRGIARELAGARLVSYDRLPPEQGEECAYQPVAETLAPLAGAVPLRNALMQARVAPTASTDLSQRKPVRMIRDPYAAYSAVAVDPAHNEVVLTDENLFNLWVYDRTATTPSNGATEP